MVPIIIISEPFPRRKTSPDAEAESVSPVLSHPPARRALVKSESTCLSGYGLWKVPYTDFLAGKRMTVTGDAPGGSGSSSGHWIFALEKSRGISIVNWTMVSFPAKPTRNTLRRKPNWNWRQMKHSDISSAADERPLSTSGPQGTPPFPWHDRLSRPFPARDSAAPEHRSRNSPRMPQNCFPETAREKRYPREGKRKKEKAERRIFS